MIKEYFTDGLLQIAIFLSLLRTDLDGFIGLSYNNRRLSPELHETFLGSLSGYTQTDIRSHNLWNAAGIGGAIHPKSIYNTYPESIFRELHSLGNFRHFDGIERNLNAFLVNVPEPLFPRGQRSNAEAASPDVSHTAEGGNSVPNNNEHEPEGAAGSENHLTYSDDDLTKEEMELIEVLWRQDIDLGIGREMFETGLRQDYEKEFDLKQEEKTEETKKDDKDREAGRNSNSFPVLDLSANYIIDGETGEIVSGPPLTVQTPEPSESMGFMDLPDMFFHDNLGGFPNGDGAPSFENDLPPLEQFDISPVEFQPPTVFEVPQPNIVERHENLVPDFSLQLSRQNSLEERWQDVMGILELQEFSPEDGTADELNMSLDLPSEPIVHNVTLANLTFTEPLFLPDGYQNNSFTYPMFLASEMNTTYQPVETSMLTAGNTRSLEILDGDVNATFLNLEEASAMCLTSTEFGDLQETNNVSNFSPDILESIFQNIFDNSTLDSTINMADASFGFEEPSNVGQMLANADFSSDSAISSLSSPPFQFYNNTDDQSDGVDEATGGKDVVSTCDMDFEKYQYNSDASFYHGSPQLETNSSTSSNDTSFRSSKVITKHMFHNHTYVLPPGAISREEKEEAVRRDKEQKATRSRDEKKAKEMKLPFTIDEIINTPVDEFTEMLSQYSLSEAQHQLIRDIRRRGKNKQAAQNCRKRKLTVIQTLEDEVTCLQRERGSLLQTRRQIDREMVQIKDKLVRLQTELFRSLRDDNGQPYNPNEYSLQQLPDGNLFLVPKNNSVEKGHAEKPMRKRKPKRKE